MGGIRCKSKPIQNHLLKLVFAGLLLFPSFALAWGTDPASLKEYAVYLAVHENLNVSEFLATIACESSFNPKAVGDHGKSFGIVQIHLPAHPDITKEQATNGIWALNWMADQWLANRQSMWSCYHKSGTSNLADN